jgi:hypothetical protein
VAFGAEDRRNGDILCVWNNLLEVGRSRDVLREEGIFTIKQ